MRDRVESEAPPCTRGRLQGADGAPGGCAHHSPQECRRGVCSPGGLVRASGHMSPHPPAGPPLSPEGSFAPTRGQSLAALATIGTTRAVRRGVPVHGRRARRDDERRNDGACPQDRPLRCGPHAQPARAASSPQARTVGSTLRDHPGVVPMAGHSHRSPRAHSAATRGHPRHDLGLSARAIFPPAFLYIVSFQRIFVGRDRDVRWPGLPPDH